MTSRLDASAGPRVPLSRERVFVAAVELADAIGIDELSMRRLGQALGVEAMSLYHHVANKEEILDGMVEVIAEEIGPAPKEGPWKAALRTRILAAREVMKRHPWAPAVIETRKTMPYALIRYMESVAAITRAGGFSVGLIHHAIHALGSRALGFSQELYDDSAEPDQSPEAEAAMWQQLAHEVPTIAAIVAEIRHQDATIVGSGCDDDVEFVFALDLILDGLERIRDEADRR
jgi:AcrR family transcriptional regulator